MGIPIRAPPHSPSVSPPFHLCQSGWSLLSDKVPCTCSPFPAHVAYISARPTFTEPGTSKQAHLGSDAVSFSVLWILAKSKPQRHWPQGHQFLPEISYGEGIGRPALEQSLCWATRCSLHPGSPLQEGRLGAIQHWGAGLGAHCCLGLCLNYLRSRAGYYWATIHFWRSTSQTSKLSVFLAWGLRVGGKFACLLSVFFFLDVFWGDKTLNVGSPQPVIPPSWGHIQGYEQRAPQMLMTLPLKIA